MTSRRSRHEGARISLADLAVNHRLVQLVQCVYAKTTRIQQNGVLLLNIGPAHAGDGLKRDSEDTSGYCAAGAKCSVLVVQRCS